MKPLTAPEEVVITGASVAPPREFARRGARIGLLARDRERLEAIRWEVEELGGRALVLPADVSDDEQVEAAAAAVERELGPINVWVNNAMITVYAPFMEVTPAEFRRVTEVTYFGYVHGMLAALRHMRPRNRGSIVQVGSALAYCSIPLQSAYCGAKQAILGFTESMRTELLHDRSRVHITLVHMPAVNTPQFDWARSRLPNKLQPVPPIYQPKVPAEAIYWTAHHCQREVFVGASTTLAIEGNKLAPGLAYHYLGHTGYRSQQTGEPADPARPDNLWEPVSSDYAAHGRFDRHARPSSPQLWLTKHRRKLGLAALGAAIGAGSVLLGRKPVSRNRRD